MTRGINRLKKANNITNFEIILLSFITISEIGKSLASNNKSDSFFFQLMIFLIILLLIIYFLWSKASHKSAWASSATA